MRAPFLLQDVQLQSWTILDKTGRGQLFVFVGQKCLCESRVYTVADSNGNRKLHRTIFKFKNQTAFVQQQKNNVNCPFVCSDDNNNNNLV
jgi:hypothetical protein